MPSPPAEASLTYGKYLEVESLLSLQRPRSSPAEHDEMLFIVIHQVYELWFKLLLHEGEKIRRDLFASRLFDALSSLRRMREVLKTLVHQLDILETMTPLEFASFRARLDVASGFQSAQFRELEFLLGHKRPQMLAFHPTESPAWVRLQRRLQEPSLVDALHAFLEVRGVQIPIEIKSRSVQDPCPPSPELQRQLVDRYRTEHDLVLLLEAFTDIDEGIQEWRYRHVKMVERTIGAKIGTGGSAGAAYLRNTLFAPLFPDLWAIRSSF
ncbi:MAG: tryptophan 2,3-dioxygenase [Myxococcota bacterium]